MRTRLDSVLIDSAALGAMTGLRSMSAAALLAREFSLDAEGRAYGIPGRFITSPVAARFLTVLAGGEMLADKTPVVPDRTTTGPLIGRAVIGSIVAAALASARRHPVFLPAVAGGAAAVASTVAAFHLRRFAGERLGIPDPVLGMLEDAAVLGVGTRIARRLGKG